MIKVTDKNRDQVIEEYVSDMVEGMDDNDLFAFAYETLMESKSLMENEALESEILDYYPDLLEHTYENSKD